MNTTKTSRGLSLVELLVVIAIVALLLAISGTSLGKTRQQSKEAICSSILKQWALVFTLYAADNEESFPQNTPEDGVTSDGEWTLDALLPYYEDLDLRDCPSTQDLNRPPSYGNMGGTLHQWGPFPPSFSGTAWYDTYTQGSYGFNDWIADPPPGESSFWGHPSAKAVRNTFEKDAHLIPMVYDSVWVEGFPKMNDWAPTNEEHAMDIYDADWSTNVMKFACIDRHNGGINAAFVDMDVRHVGVKELWLLKWHKNWTPCEPPNAWPSWTDIYEDYEW